ncbi:MAG: hypothetical protein IKO36_03200 [Bacteroidaceae bacterium]|nr:hypothetical protein [Bacteroidaceae bacterium]
MKNADDRESCTRKMIVFENRDFLRSDAATGAEKRNIEKRSRRRKQKNAILKNNDIVRGDPEFSGVK